MTESGIKNCITYGTGLGVGTIRCCSGGVTESVDFFLSNENHVTYGAVLTFGKTGFGTIGCYVSINHLGVTESGIKNCITYGTGLGVGTISCCSGGMTESGIKNCITYGTGLCVGTISCCARGVTESGKDNVHAAYLSITNGTVNYVVVRTVVHTVGKDFVFYNDFTCGVTESGNDNIHAAERYVTYVTVNNDVVRTVVYAIGNGDGFFY